MFLRARFRLMAFIAVMLLATFGRLAAADRPGDGKRPAGDYVSLKNGTRLRGLVFERTEQRVTLLVSTKWLSEAAPKLRDAAVTRNVTEHKAALAQVIDRLKAELKRDRPPAVAGFLRQQLEQIEADAAAADQLEPEFVWLTFSAREAERVDATPAERRQLMAWAWVEQLDRAETRTADELARELKGRAVSPVGWPLPLIERLPAREQSNDEWAARMAIVEYVFDKPLQFQGTGDVLVRTDKAEQINIGQLIGDLLRRQVQDQLGELFAEPGLQNKRNPPRDQPALPEALRKAALVADAESARGFRATRIDSVRDVQQAIVMTLFRAKLADGSWQTIFQHAERADSNKTAPDVLRRIQDDPRIKQVLELARQLGGAADEPIQQALRFGAATMSAQQTCDSEFANFRESYLKSLAKPPLTWGRGND